MRSKAWSRAYSSIEVHESKMRMKAQAIVAAISEDVGYEHHLTHIRSISSEQFIRFLEELHRKFKKKPLVIFMDNLMVHKSTEVKEAYLRLKITPIFNIPYSPQFNGIESYFS